MDELDWPKRLLYDKPVVPLPKVHLRAGGILHFPLGLEDRSDLPLHPRYGAS